MYLQHCFVRGRPLCSTKIVATALSYPKKTAQWSESVNLFHGYRPYLTLPPRKSVWPPLPDRCSGLAACGILSKHYSHTSESNTTFDRHHDNEFQRPNRATKQEYRKSGKRDANEAKYAAKVELEARFENYMTNPTAVTDNEWEEIHQSVIESNPTNHTSQVIDAQVMVIVQRKNSLSLGQSYMEYLRRAGREPNLVLLGNYLVLHGNNIDQCGEEEVLRLYHQFMSSAKIQELTLMSFALLGVAPTREWRQSVSLLNKMIKLFNPSAICYSAVIAAAFRNTEYDLGWHYLDLMCGQGMEPKTNVFEAWLNQCRSTGQLTDIKDKLFHKLAAHEIFPAIEIVAKIERLFQDDLKWSTRRVHIQGGVCPACNNKLTAASTTKDEFSNLQTEFVSRVVQQSDIYLNSRPEEWRRFTEFVDSHRPFSVVVDGLNSLYYNKNNKGLNVVLQLVLEMTGDKGHALVVGRHHMMKHIPRQFLRNPRIKLFLLDEITRDDSFFLYAALRSGWGTKFITSDLLRDHLSKLRLTPLQVTFRRWQRAHQIMANKDFTVMVPSKFGIIAQGSEEGWHVPYDDGAPRLPFQAPNSWLCLQPSPHTVPQEHLHLNSRQQRPRKLYPSSHLNNSWENKSQRFTKSPNNRSSGTNTGTSGYNYSNQHHKVSNGAKNEALGYRHSGDKNIRRKPVSLGYNAFSKRQVLDDDRSSGNKNRLGKLPLDLFNNSKK